MYVQPKNEARSQIIVAVENQYEYYLLVCVCMWIRVRVGVCMRISACSLANSAWNAYAPYCDVTCRPSVSTQFFDIISQTVRYSEKSYWT
jgi:hypothetical protein